MAEEDDASKTEDPTEKKLGDARNKGDVAKSVEVNAWFLLIGGAMSLILFSPYVAENISKEISIFVSAPHSIPPDFRHLQLLFSELLIDLGIILSPIFGLLVVLAIFSNATQTGLIWTTEKIKPELSKISIVKGVKRLVSSRALVEFLKGILKLFLVAIVAFGLAVPNLFDLALISDMEPVQSLERIHLLAIFLFMGTIAVMTVIAAADFVFQKHKFTQQMMMSRQEVKDEQKQSDGDPMVKARIRKIRTDRAQQRMMAAVPDADVVITNPTHYSIALSYKMGDMAAPQLVAKGVDHLAFRIREVAQSNDIPLFENPPLARALYAGVELEEEVPPEHFKAVAEVISYVMRLRGETMQ